MRNDNGRKSLHDESCPQGFVVEDDGQFEANDVAHLLPDCIKNEILSDGENRGVQLGGNNYLPQLLDAYHPAGSQSVDSDPAIPRFNHAIRGQTQKSRRSFAQQQPQSPDSKKELCNLAIQQQHQSHFFLPSGILDIDNIGGASADDGNEDDEFNAILQQYHQEPSRRRNTEPTSPISQHPDVIASRFTLANYGMWDGQRQQQQSLANQSVRRRQTFSESSTSVPLIGAGLNAVVEHSEKKVVLYKTEMCRSFDETGQCKFGVRCLFAHHRRELRQVRRHPRYKTEVCKSFYDDGICKYGRRCCFLHLERGSEQYAEYARQQQQQGNRTSSSEEDEPESFGRSRLQSLANISLE